MPTCLGLFGLVLSLLPASDTDFYISFQGNDRNSGTLSKPFLTSAELSPVGTMSF